MTEGINDIDALSLNHFKGGSVVVVGGGLAGLGAAYTLSRMGIEVLLLERDDTVGGCCVAHPVGDTWIDMFYHHLFLDDEGVIKLIDDLGMTDKLHWGTSTTAFFYKGGVHRLNSPKHILSFRPLSLSGRFWLAVLFAKLIMKNEWKELDEISAKDWICTNTSEEVYRVVFKPLLKSKYGEAAENISAAFLWERVRKRGRSRSKSGSREKLGYLEDSFYMLALGMRDRIVHSGGSVLTGAMVREIIISDGKIRGVKYEADGTVKEMQTDYLISSIPIPQFLELTSGLPSDYEKQLRHIKYQSAICAIFGLKERLSDTYWMNIIEDYPIVLVAEHTNFVSAEYYDGTHIVYTGSYVSPSDEIWKASAGEIQELFSRCLRQIFADFKEENIKWFKLAKVAHATPIHETGYLSYMPSARTPVDGLYLAGTALTYPKRTMEVTIGSGVTAAEAVLDDLGHSSSG